MPHSLFDAHLHIIDSAYPLMPNRGYLPEPYPVAEYLEELSPFNVEGGAVVSGSFQGFDQTYLLAALQQLGPQFVGVTQLPHSVSDEELVRLNRQGVRALRFNVHRGGSESLHALAAMALRVNELCGWHVELYIDSTQLGAVLSLLQDIPSFSIDHLGLSQQGLPWLLRAVELGGRVKASGFGRVSLDVAGTLQQIYQLDPGALMFGSDLPGTRAPRRFCAADIELLVDALGVDGADRVLRRNGRVFYRCGG
ncbi:amidohydrolase family protein [Aestuariirhabdus sp. LZHN29]|uniref:amidohydrolase family protein n=1 Tax=Aestuariirhabdus sp. LZHN29 TaxID=3417462 RepID=UPI003CF3CF17